MMITDTAFALQTERLGKRYGRLWALRDCTLATPEGRIIALVGPNGAGKTTLLQLVAGLLAPTEGTVRVFGEAARANTPAALARVGFVAQDHPLYKGFTVAELLRMGRRLNLRGQWDQALAELRLAAVGVPLKQRAGKLSGGQQAQVALAMALAKRPRLLLLDEPVASLDPLARREFMQTLMGAAVEDGLTVVLSSARVRLAGEVDELIASHRLLTGPRSDPAAAGRIPGVLRATHGDRQTTLLVRGAAGPERPPVHPNWQSHPVTLEDLVLAYLQLPSEPATDPSARPEQVEVVR